MNQVSLGDRMKNNYEDRYRFYLTRRTPVIMRLDGRAFHTFTKDAEKPFDKDFANLMRGTAKELCLQVQGVKCAYIQSDEISLLLTDFDRLTSEASFDYNIQKMVSLTASLASAIFSTNHYPREVIATFDCRAFNIPEEEVCNYFIWRQKDWIRNSILMLGQYHYSHKQLLNKSCAEIQEMLHNKEVNWADLPRRWKNGWLVYKLEDFWHSDPAPIFTENRAVIENYLIPKDE